MSEEVDADGRTKASGGYMNSYRQTRIAYMVNKYLGNHMNEAMKAIVAKGNETLAKGIEGTIKMHLAEISKSMTVSVKTRGT
jgi:hypothetical protein